MAKTSETTKENSILVRTIEAAAKIKFPDETEKRFQDAAFRKGLAELPKFEIGHIIRLHECMCDLDFVSDDARALRAGVMAALGRQQNLKAFPRRTATAAAAPKGGAR